MESSAEGEASEPSGLTSCPSFNSYSSDRLSDLARQVEAGHGHDHQHHHRPQDRHEEAEADEGDDCDDFEFAPADGGVCDGGFVISSDQIGPVFPVFNRDLLLENGGHRDSRSTGGGAAGGGDVRSIRIPLMDLFTEEDQDPQSDEELEGIPEGSYCVWTASESARSSPSWCKKSSSTGGSRSSKRWRFLDLLRRSNSDGKDSFVFLTPSPSNGREAKPANKGTRNGKATLARSAEAGSGLEVFYTRRKVAVKGGGGGGGGVGSRRKSYLPYRQDLVGFFAHVNSFGRTFPPFGRI